jgi:hypothetical protein
MDMNTLILLYSTVAAISVLVSIVFAYRTGYNRGYEQGGKANEYTQRLFNAMNDLVILTENASYLKAYLKAQKIRKEFPQMDTSKQRFERERRENLEYFKETKEKIG